MSLLLSRRNAAAARALENAMRERIATEQEESRRARVDLKRAQEQLRIHQGMLRARNEEIANMKRRAIGPFLPCATHWCEKYAEERDPDGRCKTCRRNIDSWRLK